MPKYNVPVWNLAIVTVTPGTPPTVSLLSLDTQVTGLNLVAAPVRFDSDARAGMLGSVNWVIGRDPMDEVTVEGKGVSNELVEAINNAFALKTNLYLRFLGSGCPVAGGSEVIIQVDMIGAISQDLMFTAAADATTEFTFGIRPNALRRIIDKGGSPHTSEYLPLYAVSKNNATDNWSAERTRLGLPSPPASIDIWGD